MTQKTPKQWANIAIGSVLTLTDEQSIKNHGIHGKQYFVKSKLTVKEQEGLCTWVFYKLDKNKSLMVKIVDDTVDLRLYEDAPTDDFALGDRNDWVNNWDELWFFAEPTKEEWTLNDLAFGETFLWDFPDASKEKFEYSKKMHDLAGESFEIPKPSGLKEPLLATVAEYNCEKCKQFPEALFLENGDADNENGGLIKLMFGYPVNPGDINVLDK